MTGNDSITVIKGIGPKKEEALSRMGINTVEDMYMLFPRDYQDRRNVIRISDADNEQVVLVKATVTRVFNNRYGRKHMLRITADDGSAVMEVLFFNAAFLAKSIKPGTEYEFYGRIYADKGKFKMLHPEMTKKGDKILRGIIPVYPLTKGISQNEMRKWQQYIDGETESVADYLPEAVKSQNNLCSLEYAIHNIHFPESRQKLLEAKYRLVFDEFFVMQTALMALRGRGITAAGGIAFSKAADIDEYIGKMPYKLTSAQQRVISEIISDMESDRVMNRLLQGDVGSGKTAVAEAALFKAVKSGYQGVLMAPTEILARQHYTGLQKSFEPFGITVDFLGGRLKASERKKVLSRLEEGKTDILIGTHAVIQPDVLFNNLGLVITDEQHRFGVNQRSLLTRKGEKPDRLVMTATPIPRTLAAVIYGDLDVSVIDELPAGRKAIVTKAVTGNGRNEVYDFVNEQLKSGRQGYIVTPLIDESEVLDARSASEVFEEINQRFDEYTVELLHGEMKQAEKDAVMDRFYNGQTDLLVSTVVIEVGINVPNATVMVIENSERFGLAQLHQLRGRVGRGAHQSYCYLINEGKSEIAAQRAEIMEASNDGFYIAEKDLELRGPGEIFGVRQHGIPEFKVGDIGRHFKIMEIAGSEAKKLLTDDPLLEKAENQKLKEKIKSCFGESFTLAI